MYPRFLRNYFIPRAFRDGLRLNRASAVPGAPNVVPRNDLDEAAGLDVANFNESTVKEEDIWWVPGNSLCSPFPLDCTRSTTWVSVVVDVQPEFYK